MPHDDRYGGHRNWRGGRDDVTGGRGRDDDRGFFERAGDEVRSWFGGDDRDNDRSSYGRRGEYEYDRGYGRDRSDRDPGAHVDYYRGGDRGQQRMGPEGGFESRSDYRRSERHADQGTSWARGRSQDQSYPPSDMAPRYGGGPGHTRHDPHYSSWRQRQIESLDRDYDEYCRENSSRFEQEFGSWREKRGQQRQSLSRVREHMEVIGSDGQHVGTVDKTAQDRIILTKSDPGAGGHHHSIPYSWVDSVDDKVALNKSSEQARQAWRDEETSRALFEDRNSGEEGPHILERSFSGTYRDE